jgi:Domain of unknown function (DUF4333)
VAPRTHLQRRPAPRALIAGVLVAASVGLGACGSSEPPAPTILDAKKVERAIEASSVAQRGTRPRVSCPAGIHQRKGLTFSCTAVVGRTSTRFVVTQLDGAGHVHYEAR